MADGRRFALTPQLDIEQILLDAQHRWLRPAEICEILKNHQKFRIAPEPPNRPPSGSLFLFDRKVLRYFRKDGHNWRKKKDGKTVKEAHERLKAGSIDVLHCYYAHGEDNENFQRRSYWMLEEDFMHIVLVHYREVEGNKSSFSRPREVEDAKQLSYVDARVTHIDSPIGSNSLTAQSQLPSQNTDAGSPNSEHTSEFEDAESDNYQSSSGYHPFIEMQQYDGPMIGGQFFNSDVPLPAITNQYDFQGIHAGLPKSDFYSVAQQDATRIFDGTDFELTYDGSKTQTDLTLWDEVLGHSITTFQTPMQSSVLLEHGPSLYDNARLVDLHDDDPGSGQVDLHRVNVNSGWELSNSDTISTAASNFIIQSNTAVESIKHSPLVKNLSLELPSVGECLKKHDSFSRWMSRELGEVDESIMNSSSTLYWNEIGADSAAEGSSLSNHEHLDSYVMNPSLSQDQLFSILDFSPNWAYADMETKVLISGKFLKDKDIEKFKWSCMFGEVEVPADVLGDGVLRCLAPPHRAGRCPFYVTCSDRLACSEIREFEFRDTNFQLMDTMDTMDNCTMNTDDMLLHIRLGKLLSLEPHDYEKLNPVNVAAKEHLSSKISSVMMGDDDDWSILLEKGREIFPENAKEQLLEALLREKLHTWLLCKIAEDGKGPSILDEEGQGVLHLVAALGYDWAIQPTVMAGVNINFRDVRGWTALHWAAYCGRERTVVALITLGAAPGVVTDPTPDYPQGRTPADLASANGHKGIAGFLAESALTSHLDALTLKDSKSSGIPEFSSLKSADDIVGRSDSQLTDDNLEAGLSAVRNASQAAARIFQVFRVQSFHRKKVVPFIDEKRGMSDEHALSLVSVVPSKTGQHDPSLHAAAIRIQNKFRGWKGRKEFLVIRQRIVKIQAHVRGHQVRKHYRKIVWSVGIVEKVILRWRRKRSGLRGFRSEGLLEHPSTQNQIQTQSNKVDDYDFLQKGRKETEDRMQKALARVKSMAQYPEAREQYRRLLAGVAELQESKAMQDNFMDESDHAADDAGLI